MVSEMYVLIGVVIILCYTSIRNCLVFIERMRVLNRIYKAKGNNFIWRLARFHEVSYDSMMLKFWRRVGSFYDPKIWEDGDDKKMSDQQLWLDYARNGASIDELRKRFHTDTREQDILRLPEWLGYADRWDLVQELQSDSNPVLAKRAKDEWEIHDYLEKLLGH